VTRRLTEKNDRCKRRLMLQWSVLLLIACLFQPLHTRAASEARIYDTRALLVEGVYRVGARVEFELNSTLQQALENGVPLALELQIEVIRERDWLWPYVVAELRQRFALQYHALSEHYLVKNFSTGTEQSFTDLDTALVYIGTVYDLPLIDANLLKPGQRYWVRMRAVLDIEALPTPVRLWAYLGSDWALRSDWHQWPLNP
jgi:hypothetical protein